MFSNDFNNKSLSEQINEVVKSKVSRKEKMNALIKLGLRENEVSVILPNEPREPREKFIYTFGVEIECVMPRNNFGAAAERNGVRYHFEGYNHDDNREYFKFVTDGSLSRTSGREGDPIECVSPILDGKKAGFDKLKACCSSLNEANAYVNRTTGLHVHIGSANITNEQYVNVFKNYQKLQGIINSVLAPSRRNNYYCNGLTGYDFSWCNIVSDISSELNHNRYFAVNPCSWGRHNTIEFRQHQGTTDFTKIKNWVNFCAKLVAYSAKHVLGEVSSIDEIPFLTKAEKNYFNERKATFEGR